MAANPPVLSVPPHRGLIALVVVTLFVGVGGALIAIAWMLGWIAPRAAVYSPPGPIVSSAPRAPATAEGLDPGETVVPGPDAAPRTLPMMPTYSSPLVPAPAPTTRDAVPVAPAPAVPVPARKSPPSKREAYVQADPAAVGPTTPSFTRPSAVCANCGVVSAITTYPPGLWEVRVRMQDSELQSFRFRREPSLRIGDRVRVDGARLALD